MLIGKIIQRILVLSVFGCVLVACGGSTGNVFSTIVKNTTGGSSGSVGTVGTAIPIPSVRPPEVRAADLDDNLQWDQYLAYRVRSGAIRKSIRDVDISERHIITVTGNDGAKLFNARVRIFQKNTETLVSQGYTQADGRVMFFPLAVNGNAFASLDVTVEKDGKQAKFVLIRAEKTEWAAQLDLKRATPDRAKLDLLFLFDTTSSMSDELQRLQANMSSVARQIEALSGQPDVRYGLVAYKDRGDEYVTHIDPFTADMNSFQIKLNALAAGGGGDIPESLNAGLHDAIHGLEWRGDDTIKLIFLIADAGPHLDYKDDFDYAVEMREAASRGIKIHSLAASGLTAQGEYVFRQLSQYTMGHFIFITYANAAAAQGQNPIDSRPGEDTNMNVEPDSYQTELLDGLVVRLVRTELAALKAR